MENTKNQLLEDINETNQAVKLIQDSINRDCRKKNKTL